MAFASQGMWKNTALMAAKKRVDVSLFVVAFMLLSRLSDCGAIF
jgi:hypothetical protein